MTKTHGNTHGGDKWGNATLKNELKSLRYVRVMLVLQCTRRDASKKLKETGTRLLKLLRKHAQKQLKTTKLCRIITNAMISYLSSP